MKNVLLKINAKFTEESARYDMAQIVKFHEQLGDSSFDI